MLSFLRLLLVTLLVSISLKSIATPPPKTDKSLLWRISSKEMKKPSYLFGTMHMICPEDYLWTPAMQKRFDSANSVCFEMDLDEPGLMVEVATGLMDYSGKKLKDYFKEEDYTLLSRFLTDSMKVDIATFQQMKPAALFIQLSTDITPCEEPVFYEFKMMDDSKKQNKEILGLEKPAEQLDLFDNMHVDSVVKQIMDIITGKENATSEYEKLVQAYKGQNIQLLYKLMQESAKKDIDLAGFIDVRNEKWISRMGEKMDQQSVFFAVGAGHLWGEYGLIKLLRAAGYKVEPILQ